MTARNARRVVSLATEADTNALVTVYVYTVLALKMVDLMVTNLSVLTSELVSKVRVCVVVPALTSTTLTAMLAAELDVVAVGEATGVGVLLPAAGVVVALGFAVAVGVPLPTVAVAVGVGIAVGDAAECATSVVLGSLFSRV